MSRVISYPAGSSSPDENTPSGADLIGAARLGTDADLGKLLQGCRDYLLLIANRELDDNIRRKVAASDLVQETLAEAYQGFAGFRGQTDSQFLAWLRQILFNNIADVVSRFRNTAKRDTARERELDGGSQGHYWGAALVDPQPTPAAVALVEEARLSLMAALGRLPDNYRIVISLRNLELLNYVQIGERMECSPDSARKLWDRAMRRLGNELGANDVASRRPRRSDPNHDGGSDVA